jgi:outer membrane receptor protein involved in Fe transport
MAQLGMGSQELAAATVRNAWITAAALAALAALPTGALAQAPQEGPDEIVVTGTYIPRPSQFDSPSPLVAVGRDDFLETGADEIGDVIEDLTINTGSENNPDAFTQNQTTGTSNVNLRGLGVASTLVLINGRRQTPAAVATDRGENFVDTSSLPPMIAIDRVEILKDGAAALYCSEAVAGVVNFLTRRSFEGVEAALDYQEAGHGQQDVELGVLYGVGNERTHFLAAFSRLDRNLLTTAERRLSTIQDDLSQAGNPGSFLIPTRPAHPVYGAVWAQAFDSNHNDIADFVEPAMGLPAVPGAQPPVFADQDCAAIAAVDPKVVPAIVANVPTPIGPVPLGLCEFDFGSFWSLVPREERNIGYLELTHSFGDRLEGRFEFHVADNKAYRNNSPSFPFAQFPVVAATHPDNPYGTNVQFIGRLIGAGGTPIESEHLSDTRRFAGSLNGSVNGVWDWETGVQWSENDFFVTAPDVLADRFALALQGRGGPDCGPVGTRGVTQCFYFNPFGNALTGAGTPNPPALLDDLLAFERIDARSELLTVDAVVSRRLGELAGGPIGLAVGAQYRSEELAHDYDENANRDNFVFLVGNPDFKNDRDIDAVFAELALPISETLSLQVAARYEDYGDIDSTDPKVTMLWRPTLDLSVRASVGTSFRAPSLFQSFGTQTTLTELIDPRIGTPQFFPVRTQPDPSGEPLQPEEADVANLGVTWSPTDALELSLDYWSFDYTNVIIEQSAQAILTSAAAGNAGAANQVIRDPSSGLLLRVVSYYDNASSLDTDGVDVRASYELPFGGSSTYRIGAEGTYVSSYDIVDPQAGAIDGAGRRNYSNFATSVPQWRANAFFNWRRGSHLVDVFVRYIDSYLDDQVAPGEPFRKIASQTTTDFRYGYRFRAEKGPMLSVGAVNLFDKDPPHVHTNGGYDSKVHDPRGRVVYARASIDF